MKTSHLLAPELLTARVKVLLVGVGGTGALMAACLGKLNTAMLECGHPVGLHVTAIDPGTVRAANIGRQQFSKADIGQYKAVVTIHRLNRFYGLDWTGLPCDFDQYVESENNRNAQVPDILISCVDTRAARRSIHRAGHCARYRRHNPYWMDLGNTDDSGNCVLGQFEGNGGVAVPCGVKRLPCVTDLFPDILDPAIPDDNAPSCSVRMSILNQGLFVNSLAADAGAELLKMLFLQGGLDIHGFLFKLATFRMEPLYIDSDVWRRFGVSVAESAIAAATVPATGEQTA